MKQIVVLLIILVFMSCVKDDNECERSISQEQDRLIFYAPINDSINNLFRRNGLINVNLIVQNDTLKYFSNYDSLIYKVCAHSTKERYYPPTDHKLNVLGKVNMSFPYKSDSIIFNMCITGTTCSPLVDYYYFSIDNVSLINNFPEIITANINGKIYSDILKYNIYSIDSTNRIKEFYFKPGLGPLKIIFTNGDTIELIPSI